MSNQPLSPCEGIWESVDRLRIWHDIIPWEEGRDAQQAIDQMTAELAANFALYFDPAEVAERFVIPEEYLCFIKRCKGTSQRDDRWGLGLYDTELVVSNTLYQCSVMGEIRPPTAGIWIEIGHFSDKHDLFLCCDRHLPLYGYVVDGHDDHPWIPDGLINSCIMRGDTAPSGSIYESFLESFLQFLQLIVQERFPHFEGTSQWRYFTPYQPDVAAAFYALQKEVFQKGAFYDPRVDLLNLLEELDDETYLARMRELRQEDLDSGGITEEEFHAPIEPRQERIVRVRQELEQRTIQGVHQAYDSGTHSILDISHISDQLDLFSVSPLEPQDVITLFRTDKPTHEMIESHFQDSLPLLHYFIGRRYRGLYLVVWKDDQPHEYFFCGRSGGGVWV